MISGYLILRQPNSLQHGYFKRLLKIGIPLVVWSIVYLVVRWWTIGTDLMGNSINFYNGIRCILSGNVSAHLWFLYVIFALYLVAPILHSYLKSASRENKIYFLLLWGCACFLCPIIFGALKILFDIDKVNLNFYIVGGSVGYFVAGYFLGHRTISSKTCLLCFVSLVSIALITTWAGFVLSDSEHNVWMFIVYRLQIPLTLLFFVVLKYIGNTELYRKSVLSVVISRFSPLTFGIYIVHILVMHVVGDGVLGFSLNIRTFDPWFSSPLTVMSIFLLSALVVWLLKKIPHSHWILP
jgi:surface polysaccharide O-acyltransferase-like enzyme